MQDVYVLRHQVLIEGQSRRQVARELGISRNTVRRYLEAPEPARRERIPRSRPFFDAVQSRLDALLSEWSERTTPKQRLTATWLHRQLCEESCTVDLTTVRECRRQRAEVYIPLVHRPTDEAQIDFFAVTVELNGEHRRVWKFLVRLMNSGRVFCLAP